VTIAPDLVMILPRPSDLGRDVRMDHLVTARYGERVISFEGHIEVTGGDFRMAVIDALGRQALRVEWTGEDIVYSPAPWMPEALQPRNILADLVLIYWPPEVLRRALAPAHASLAVTPGCRAVVRDGVEIIRVDFFPGGGGGIAPSRVSYRNLAFGYSLDIRAVENRL
jgi:hypothetical protein